MIRKAVIFLAFSATFAAGVGFGIASAPTFYFIHLRNAFWKNINPFRRVEVLFHRPGWTSYQFGDSARVFWYEPKATPINVGDESR